MTLWRGSQPLILASQSLPRQTLLKNAGLVFEAIPANLDERTVQLTSGLHTPDKIAELLAREKAIVVSHHYQNRLVIGADQTLALDCRIFSKPASRAEAAEQLKALAGRAHELHSAVAVAQNSEVLFAYCSVASMTMRPLNDSEISTYLDLAGDAVTSSVGAYQFEKLGVHLFDRIEGDYFTILGLPLLPLLDFLRRKDLLVV